MYFSSEENSSQIFWEQRPALHLHGQSRIHGVHVPQHKCLIHPQQGCHSCIIPACSCSLLCWAHSCWELKHWSPTVQCSRGRGKEHRENKEQLFNRKGLAAPFNINPDAIYSALVPQYIKPIKHFARIILFNYFLMLDHWEGWKEQVHCLSLPSSMKPIKIFCIFMAQKLLNKSL